MSYGTVLLKGYARWLDANDFGTYREDGVFAPTERGIVVSAMPEAPTEVLSVTRYLPEYFRSYSGSRYLAATRVQLRFRLSAGNPLAGEDLFDRLFEAQDRQRLELGALSAHVHYLSFSPLGMDKNGRWAWTTNWQFTGIQAV